LDVVGMTRARTIVSLDEYEQVIDEIVAACDGDIRGALMALLALNERLELRLERMSAQTRDTEEELLPMRTLH
jgi:hypothetical protein